MKKYKLLIIICFIFFIISMSCYIIGAMHKDRKHQDINKDDNTSVEIDNKVVECPSFYGYSYDYVKDFAKENELELTFTEEYSNYSSGTIIYQSIMPGTTIVAGMKLEIIISKGKNPNAVVIPTPNQNDASDGEESDEETDEFDDFEDSEEVKTIKSKLKIKSPTEIISVDKIGNYYSVVVSLDEDWMKTKAMLVNKKSYKVLLSKTVNTDKTNYIPKYVKENNFILLEQICNAECSDYYSELYTTDLKELSKDFDSVTFDGEYAIVLSKNVTTKFDKKGNIINDNSQTSDGETILNVLSEYKLVLIDNSIYLKNGDNKYYIDKLNSNRKYHDSFVYNGVIVVSILDKTLTAQDYIDDHPDHGPYEEDNDIYDENTVFAYNYEFDINTKKIEKSIENYINDGFF